MSEPYVGEIRMVGFSFAPNGWAFCDGSLISIADNDTLFTLIGTTYGGDGVNTFALPNLLGRVPIHMGVGAGGNYIIGQMAGTENITLSTGTLPTHNHALEASTTTAASTAPSGKELGVSRVNTYISPTSVVSTTTVTDGGSGQNIPHSNLMPYQCINFVISLFGVYPSQN